MQIVSETEKFYVFSALKVTSHIVVLYLIHTFHISKQCYWAESSTTHYSYNTLQKFIQPHARHTVRTLMQWGATGNWFSAYI